MENSQIDNFENITLYLDESSAFNRQLLSFIKQWDRKHSIEVKSSDTLKVVDRNGSSFQGAEAVPIILKHLPFGKLAAAVYILPGTMWVTKQLYSMRFTH
jgi:predicted DCC family thiol-disulfide oxidoreductase YuxK